MLILIKRMLECTLLMSYKVDFRAETLTRDEEVPLL